MKIMLISAAVIILLAFTSTAKLTGRWESRLADGNILGFIFKPDNSFEGYINKKPFVSGNYTLQENIFSIEGNGCPGIKGIYKINFFQ